MPKKRSKKEGESEKREEASVKAENKPVTHVKKPSRKKVDVDEWLEKNLDELVLALGLDSLGLSKEEYMEMLKQPVEMLFGSSSSKPDVETIVKRFRRYGENVYPLIAQSILTLRDSLNTEQLEFISNNIGRFILRAAPKIYREAIRLGKHDLLPQLRSLWRIAWLELKTRVLPVECPICRFNSLVKDLTCLVCGSIVNEKVLKKFINFTSLLREFLSLRSCSEIEKLLRYDYVLLNNNGVKHPEDLRDENVDIEILLDREDKELIRGIYNNICRS